MEGNKRCYINTKDNIFYESHMKSRLFYFIINWTKELIDNAKCIAIDSYSDNGQWQPALLSRFCGFRRALDTAQANVSIASLLHTAFILEIHIENSIECKCYFVVDAKEWNLLNLEFIHRSFNFFFTAVECINKSRSSLRYCCVFALS